MAKGRVTKDKVSDKDPFINIKTSAKDAKSEVDMLNMELEVTVELAKEVKKGLGLVKPSDTKSIREMNQLMAGANTLSKERISLDAKLKVARSDEIQKNVELKLQLAEQKKSNKELAKQKLIELGVLKDEKKIKAQLIEQKKREREEAKKVLKVKKQEELARKKAFLATKEGRLETAKSRLENARANREAKRTAELQDRLTGAYRRATIRLAIVTKRLKDAKISGKLTRREMRRLERQFASLSGQVRRADLAAKDFSRNVGNYPKVMGRARAAIGSLGLAMGGLLIARKVAGAMTELEEGAANISKTTGLAKEAAIDLSVELLKIDTRTPSAALQELATSAGRLGIEGKKNIIEFATAADKVFVSLGDDLDGTADEIATNIGKISSLFGLEQEFGIGIGIEKVGSGINEVAANSKAAAPAILDFTNRLAGLSDVLDVEDVTALGALFDEAGQSSEVAASTMLRLLPNLAKEFKKFSKIAGKTPEEFKKIAEEAPIEALKLVAIGAKSNEKGLFALTETLENYGIESVRATGIVTVLSNNTDRLTELQKISGDAIRENTSLTDEFNSKNNTLLADVSRLQKKFTEWLFGINKATGGLSRARKAVQFLTRNLDSILRVLKLVIAAWAGWKLGVFTKQIVDATRGIGAMVKSLRSVKTASDAAKVSQDRLNTSVKSNPWGAIASVIATVIALLWDYANAADAATESQDLLNASVDRANQTVLENQTKLEKEIDMIRLKAEETLKAADIAGATEEELSAIRNKSVKDSQAVLDAEIAQLRELQEVRDKNKRDNETHLRHLESIRGTGRALFNQEDAELFDRRAIAEDIAQNKVFEEQIEALQIRRRELELTLEVKKKTAKVPLEPETPDDTDKDPSTRLKELKKLLKENRFAVERLANENTKATDARVIALNTEGRLYQSQIEAIEKLLSLELEIAEIEDRASKKRLALLAAELDAQKKLIAFNSTDSSRDPEGAVFIDEVKIKRDLEIKKSQIELKFLRETLAEKLKLIAESADFEGKTFEEIQKIRLEVQTLENKIRTEEQNAALEDNSKEQLDLENEFLDRKLNGRKASNEELLAAEKEFQETLASDVLTEEELDAALDKRNQVVLGRKKESDKEILKAEKEFQKKLLDLKIEGLRLEQFELDPNSERFKEIDNEILQLQDEQNELDKETAEDREERFRRRGELVDFFTQKFLADADARIAKIEEEGRAAERQANLLAGLAASGNITAQQSLAQQDQIIEESNRRKAAEEKRKQNIQLVSSVIQSYNSALAAGATPSEALASSIANTVLLTEFVEALPTFLEGTEDTGTHGQGIDGKGGFLSVLHPKERVVDADNNKALAGISNDELAAMAEESRYGSYIAVPMGDVGGANLGRLEVKLDGVIDAIENQPTMEGYAGDLTATYMEWNEMNKQGNDVTHNVFKVEQ